MMLRKSVRHLYYEQIRLGYKIYEGRLKSKLYEWNLHLGKLIIFYDEENEKRYMSVEITEILEFEDFATAYDNLGYLLMPGKSKEETVAIYNKIYENDTILKEGVICIGFKILQIVENY